MQTTVGTWKYLLMNALMSFINDLISMTGYAEYVMLSILGHQAAQVSQTSSQKSTRLLMLISIWYKWEAHIFWHSGKHNRGNVSSRPYFSAVSQSLLPVRNMDGLYLCFWIWEVEGCCCLTFHHSLLVHLLLCVQYGMGSQALSAERYGNLFSACHSKWLIFPVSVVFASAAPALENIFTYFAVKSRKHVEAFFILFVLYKKKSTLSHAVCVFLYSVNIFVLVPAFNNTYWPNINPNLLHSSVLDLDWIWTVLIQLRGPLLVHMCTVWAVAFGSKQWQNGLL